MEQNNDVVSVGKTHVAVKGNVIKTFFDAVNRFTDDVIVSVEKTGLYVRAVDAGKVSMIDLYLSIKECSEYDWDASVDLALNLKGVREVLSLAGSDDLVHINHSTDNKEYVIVSINHLKRKIRLDDATGLVVPKIPELTLDATFTTQAKEMAVGIKAADQITDEVTISSSKDKVVFSARGDTDDMELTLEKEQGLIDIKSVEKVKSLFAVDYLSIALAQTKADTEVMIEFSEDSPARLSYKLFSGNMSFVYVIAPRIES